MDEVWEHLGKRRSLRKLSGESAGLRLKKTPGSKMGERDGPSAGNSKESSNAKPKLGSLECNEDEEIGDTSRNLSRQSDTDGNAKITLAHEVKDTDTVMEISEYSLRTFLLVREFANFLAQINFSLGELTGEPSSI